MVRGLLALLCALPCGALADTVVARNVIRAKQTITENNLQIANVEASGAFTDMTQILGLEARVALYPGRPIFPKDVMAPALIERNDIVAIVFVRGGLRIETEGRAMERGAIGASVRVLNLASRTTLVGTVLNDGTVEVR